MTDRDLREELDRLCRGLDEAAAEDGLPPLASGGHRRMLLGASLALSLAACGETPVALPYGVSWDWNPPPHDLRLERRSDTAPDGLRDAGRVDTAAELGPSRDASAEVRPPDK